MMRISAWRLFVAASAFALASTNASAATISLDLTASDGGFTAQNLGVGANTWSWSASGWQVGGLATASLQRLLTPVFTADGTSWGLVLTHSFNFEPGFDGGQVYVSVNGGAFSLLAGAPYNATLATGFGNPRAGQAAFSGFQSAFITATFSGATTPGTTFQFAFDGAWDTTVNSFNEPDWRLTSLELRDFVAAGAAVPEPSTWLLLGTGLALVARRRITKRT
jgi:hypothetical protein